MPAIGAFHSVAQSVWADIGTTARLLKEALPGPRLPQPQVAELAERWRLWREDKAGREAADTGAGINSALIFKAQTLPPDAIICVDVGNNTYSFGRYFECRGRQSVVMSGYLGSIGFGFPAAMGAWAVDPTRRVYSVSGDGGFGQYMGDFTTAVKYGMKITHVLLNNSELGKISKEQRDGEWKVWQTSLHNPNFADFAKLCGGRGYRVSEASGLQGALQQAIRGDGPSLVEVIADPVLT